MGTCNFGQPTAQEHATSMDPLHLALSYPIAAGAMLADLEDKWNTIMESEDQFLPRPVKQVPRKSSLPALSPGISCHPTLYYYDFERHGTADKNCPIHWYSSSPFSRYSLPFDDSTWSATLYDFERQVGSHRHQHCIADKHCTADTGLSPSSHWYSLIYFRRYSSSSVKAENSKFLTTRSVSQFWSVS